MNEIDLMEGMAKIFDIPNNVRAGIEYLVEKRDLPTIKHNIDSAGAYTDIFLRKNLILRLGNPVDTFPSLSIIRRVYRYDYPCTVTLITRQKSGLHSYETELYAISVGIWVHLDQITSVNVLLTPDILKGKTTESILTVDTYSEITDEYTEKYSRTESRFPVELLDEVTLNIILDAANTATQGLEEAFLDDQMRFLSLPRLLAIV